MTMSLLPTCIDALQVTATAICCTPNMLMIMVLTDAEAEPLTVLPLSGVLVMKVTPVAFCSPALKLALKKEFACVCAAVL